MKEEYFRGHPPHAEHPEIEQELPVDEGARLRELFALVKTPGAFLMRHKGTVTIKGSKGEVLFHENERAFDKAMRSLELTQGLLDLEKKKQEESHGPVVSSEAADPLLDLTPMSKGDKKGN